jgi:hypothetical protein
LFFRGFRDAYRHFYRSRRSFIAQVRKKVQANGFFVSFLKSDESAQKWNTEPTNNKNAIEQGSSMASVKQ